MIAVTKKLHDSFTVHLEAKKVFIWPYLLLLVIEISTEKGCEVVAVSKN